MRTSMSNRFIFIKDHFILGIIGDNRTGKSVTAKEIIKFYQELYCDKKTYVFDPHGSLNEVSDFIIRDQDGLNKLSEVKNALIVIDSANRLINGENFNWELTMRNAEANNNDIIYVSHSPELLSHFTAYHTTHYLFFYTKEKSQEYFLTKNPLILHSAATLINDYVKSNDGFKGEYPDFPYIEVNKKINGIKVYHMWQENI